ncbi:MAG TPA: hypothetical protein VNP93_05565 [Gaiellaceae bacterium]|nr:hypothetical protein [Gaiellaceae bacterium]
MGRKNRIRLVASAGAALAVAGGGAAFAADELTPRQESSAIIDDAAKQLGVDSTELADALEQALENRVDEAVADGRLTKEQGAELKARIASGEVPLLGLRGGGPGFGHHGHGPGARLDAAATFLGLTQAELREQLRDGKSLAEIAKAEGKPVAALVDALVAAAKTELAEAVESGRLTDAQRDRIVEELEDRITEGVNATPGEHFRGGPRFHGGPGFRGGPDGSPPAGESGYQFGGGTEPPAAA